MISRGFEIVVPGGAAGLGRDAQLLQRHLDELGHAANVVQVPATKEPIASMASTKTARSLGLDRLCKWSYLAMRAAKRVMKESYQNVTIHLQSLPVKKFMTGSPQVLIPNPEWVLHRDIWKLSLVDVVLCKTLHAVKIFSAVGCRVEYLGFTSEDCHVPGIQIDRSHWLHLASSGLQKGTAEIIEAWLCHPHWPQLTVIDPKGRHSNSASNLVVVQEWLDEPQLRALMQSCGVHICASNAEGFGHTIVEAMGCGTLVITTDIAPMNELVDESRGVLVEVKKFRQRRWGAWAVVEQQALEEAVETAIELSDAEYSRRTTSARQWYLENDLAFKNRLGAIAAQLSISVL